MVPVPLVVPVAVGHEALWRNAVPEQAPLRDEGCQVPIPLVKGTAVIGIPHVTLALPYPDRDRSRLSVRQHNVLCLPHSVVVEVVQVDAATT